MGNTFQVKVAEAHKEQLSDFELQREIRDVQTFLSSVNVDSVENAVAFLFLEGRYDDFEKKMTSVMLFLNGTGKPIKELRGTLRLKTDGPVQFAKASIAFDQPFMGVLQDHEALLIHMNIPVRGLRENRVFKASDIEADFSEVQVKYE